jgi:aarF domain-containing kinase
VLKLQFELKAKLKDMMSETIHYPKELIFISRNMNLVRSLNKYYGGVADRITIMANSAYIGAQTENAASK